MGRERLGSNQGLPSEAPHGIDFPFLLTGGVDRRCGAWDVLLTRQTATANKLVLLVMLRPVCLSLLKKLGVEDSAGLASIAA